MVAPISRRVNAPALAVMGALLGCTAPVSPPRTDAPVDLREPLALGPGRELLEAGRAVGAQLPLPEGRFSAPLDELDLAPRFPQAPPMASDGPLAEIGPPLTDVGVNRDLGEALQERLDALDPDDVEQLGVALLTLDELFGNTLEHGLCDDPELILEGSFQDQAYTATLDVPTFFQFVGEPEADMTTLGRACQNALLNAEGDIDAALAGNCDETAESEFFAAGTDCRACLESGGGDYDACVSSGECREEVPTQFWIQEEAGPRFYDAAIAYIYACAPTWTVLTYLLGDFEDDGTLPPTFDHERWAYLCLPYWDTSTESVSFTCVSGEGGPQAGDTLGEGYVGRINGVIYEGSDTVHHRGRMAYSHSITTRSDVEIGYFWGFTPSGAGIISMPQVIPDSNGNGEVDLGDENYGFGLGGWGINPHAMRPDGTDPTALDDTMARDWLAVLTLKFSTARNGIPIHIFNHNRCAEGSWQGPDSLGRYRCDTMDAPDGAWLNDVDNTWTDSSFTQAYAMPMVTTASTGLPDDDVPTGIVPYMAGSPALENPDWEGCSWPHTFEPDFAPMEDTPGVFGERASLWSQTYKLGKDPDQDLRAVLSTNRLRYFCPEEGE